MDRALRIDGLHKVFKTGFIPRRTHVLKGITLEVEPGRIFGYLGPNGAGKTTTIKCILGLIFPDRGTIEVLGRHHMSLKSKARIGYLPENPYFYDYLTASEFLDFYGRLFGMPAAERADRARELIRTVGLERASGVQLRKFSRGMLQRIGLAQALLNRPDLVLLDEPMSGLDPVGRREIRDIIVGLKREGRTVFLSSHILQDIEMICDRVAVILDGRILDQGKIEDLISEKILYTEIIVSGIPPADLTDLGVHLSSSGDRTLLRIDDESRVEEVLALVAALRGKIHSLTARSQTLEDYFIDKVKKP